MDHKFKNAITGNNLQLLKQLPKTDLHNHGGLGCRVKSLEDALGLTIESPQGMINSLTDMRTYINKILKPIYQTKAGFEFAISAALFQAADDGVAILEMSIDLIFLKFYESPGELVEFLREAHWKQGPGVDFRPEIGIDREAELDYINNNAEQLIETKYFESIDIYGKEDAKPVKDFKGLFKKAKNAGLKLNAHSGEYGSAQDVKIAIEELELDAVQHGINIIESKEVMRWVRDHKIPLNICPTSNVVLKRVESLKKHPIKAFFDYGIKVTINTDDILIFDQSVSQEYLNLYQAGVFNEEELNKIRNFGLKC